MANNITHLLQSAGDFRILARNISIIENEVPGYEKLLQELQPSDAKIIGITGAPGSGKSTLTDALIEEIIKDKKKVAVLCVDPSSPFNRGALLGDRIRMSEWYNHPDVFIRSLASKGSLGGLHPKIVEISDLVKSAGFDYIIIETVGVGQSEVDIAAMADITIVVMVPEGGDIIQTMKAGLMEIADIFVINKFDRPEAAAFYNNIKQMLAPAFHKAKREIPVLTTIASQKEGVHELYKTISGWESDYNDRNKIKLLTDKIISIIHARKMKDINREELQASLKKEFNKEGFNIYQFADKYYK